MGARMEVGAGAEGPESTAGQERELDILGTQWVEESELKLGLSSETLGTRQGLELRCISATLEV